MEGLKRRRVDKEGAQHPASIPPGNNKCYFTRVHKDVLLHCIFPLLKAKALSRVAATCKRFRTLATKDKLWEKLLSDKFSNKEWPEDDHSYYASYTAAWVTFHRKLSPGAKGTLRANLKHAFFDAISQCHHRVVAYMCKCEFVRPESSFFSVSPDRWVSPAKPVKRTLGAEFIREIKAVEYTVNHSTVETLRFLLDGKYVEMTQNTGFEAVKSAVLLGCKPKLQCLLRHGAKLNPTHLYELVGKPYSVDLYIFCFRRLSARHQDSVLFNNRRCARKDLLDACLKHYKGNYNHLLMSVASQSFVFLPGFIEMILSYGASPEASNSKGETALAVAASTGHEIMVQTLLEKGADPNRKCPFQLSYAESVAGPRSPLLIACSKKHSKTVKVLLDNGANPNEVVHHGPLVCLSVTKQDIDSAKALLKAGAVFDVETLEQHFEEDFFLKLCMWGDAELLHLCLVTTNSLESPLDVLDEECLFSAFRARNWGVAEALLELGVSPDCWDREGRHIMHQAVFVDDPGFLTSLIFHGAPVDVLTFVGGLTPLQCACFALKLESARVLLAMGADPNLAADNTSPPLKMAREKKCEALQLLLEQHGAKDDK